MKQIVSFGTLFRSPPMMNSSHVLPPSVIVALTALASLASTPACSKSARAEPSPASLESVPKKVATQQVTARTVPVWLSLTGQLKGSREADLAANANGKVIKTLVERGTKVKAGQPLAILDTRAAALSLAEA